MTENSLPEVLARLRSGDWGAQRDALEEAFEGAHELPAEVLDAVVDLLPDAEEPVRFLVARHLGRFDAERQTRLCSFLFQDPSRQIQDLARRTLRRQQRQGRHRHDPAEIRRDAERRVQRALKGPISVRQGQRLARALFARSAHEFAHDYRKRGQGALQCLESLEELLEEAGVKAQRYHVALETIASALHMGIRHCEALETNSSGKAPPATEFDLAELVEQVFRALESSRDGVEFRSRVPRGLSLLQVKPSLRRVLENLVDNAVAESETSFVEVAARADGETVRIEVTDDAGGIPEHVRPRIWELMFTTRGAWLESEHSGQGLATVDRLVLEHCQGEVDLEPLEGGSCFWVEIPREVEG